MHLSVPRGRDDGKAAWGREVRGARKWDVREVGADLYWLSLPRLPWKWAIAKPPLSEAVYPYLGSISNFQITVALRSDLDPVLTFER